MQRCVVVRMGAATATLAIAVVAFLGVAAAPASAHTISGPRPSNFRSYIVKVDPEIPGVSVRVVDLGSKIELTNHTSTEVTVLGYEGEPYLRIGPNGVFENLHSQATYYNKGRNGGSAPADVDTSPSAPPEWKKISDGHTARWHDHRAHWMGTQAPPAVAQDPSQFQQLSVRQIIYKWGTTRVAVSVGLDWVPGPSGLPWLPVVVVLFAIGVFAAVRTRGRQLLVGVLAVMVLADLAHAIAYEIPRPGTNTAKVLQFAGGGFVSIVVWIVAVLAILWVWRRRSEALYAVVFVALMVALIGGATDLSALWKSQLPNAGPHLLTRIEIVAALGLGAGVVVGTVIRMVRMGGAPLRSGGKRWLSLLVVGLSDDELERIAGDLDVDEVLGAALPELAERLAPATADIGARAVVVAVDGDESPEQVWSIAADDSGALHAAPNRDAEVLIELGAAFPVWLRVLAGSVPLVDAVASGVVHTRGDVAFVQKYGDLFAEAVAPEPVAVSPAPGAGASVS